MSVLSAFVEEHRLVLGGLAAAGSCLFLFDELCNRPKGARLCAGPRLLRVSFLLALFAVALNFALLLPMPYQPVDLSGKTFLVTGCTPNGIGENVARELLAWNASSVICTMRTEEKAEALKASMAGLGPGKLDTVIMELTDFNSVRTAAQEIRTRFPLLDGVLLNAGLMTAKRSITKDGFDEMFQVNHLSQFLLLTLIKDRLNKHSRVSFVSSSSYFFLANLDKETYGKKPGGRVTFEEGLSNFVTYTDTKLMNILTANAFARRLAPLGIRVNSVCPGIVSTNFNSRMPKGYSDVLDSLVKPIVSRSPRLGALKPLFTLVNTEETAFFYDPYIPMPLRQVNQENEEWLFETSNGLLGLNSW